MLSYAYNAILYQFGALKMIDNQFRYFSGKIVTSLADILQWKKLYSKLFSGIKFSFFNRFSKLFVAVFKTSGMQNGGMVIFYLRLSEK